MLNVVKSNAEGNPDSQKVAGLLADIVPEVNVSYIVIVTVAVSSKQAPLAGTVYVKV